jgi:hypothetical protein
LTSTPHASDSVWCGHAERTGGQRGVDRCQWWPDQTCPAPRVLVLSSRAWGWRRCLAIAGKNVNTWKLQGRSFFFPPCTLFPTFLLFLHLLSGALSHGRRAGVSLATRDSRRWASPALLPCCSLSVTRFHVGARTFLTHTSACGSSVVTRHVRRFRSKILGWEGRSNNSNGSPG